jgi:hypothetical protein
MWKMRALNPPRVGTEAVIEINMGKARNIGTTLQSRKRVGWQILKLNPIDVPLGREKKNCVWKFGGAQSKWV